MIDIGIASYQNPARLDDTLRALRTNTQGDFRVLVVDNNSPDPEVHKILDRHAEADSRIEWMFEQKNHGYVGAVNIFLEWAESDYVVYCDNDCRVETPGWDTHCKNALDQNSELAMVFGKGPGGGAAYPIPRTNYTEVLWGIGCFWMLRREAQKEVGLFDTTLGHQEEVDFQTRLRMEGWKFAILPQVKINHGATASRSPEAEARIAAGIKNWVNKWDRYFTGKLVNYDSPNVLRFEDWPPNALYLEEFYQRFIGGINDNPEHILIEGREYDLLKVPRAAYGGGTFYRGRII